MIGRERSITVYVPVICRLDSGKRKDMKRIFKSLVAMVLALALAFTFAPASAQAAGLKFRQGTIGKTYKLPVVLPGNVQVKANVTVKEQYSQTYYDGSVATIVKYHVEYPKSQKNIIKRNTTRILQSCPVKKTAGFLKYVSGPVDLVYGVYDASGKLAKENPYFGYAWRRTNTIQTTFKHGRNQLEMLTSYDLEFVVANLPSVNGPVYAGVATATKPVTVNNKKYKKYTNGSASLKQAGFFKKGGKNGVFTAG